MSSLDVAKAAQLKCYRSQVSHRVEAAHRCVGIPAWDPTSPMSIIVLSTLRPLTLSDLKAFLCKVLLDHLGHKQVLKYYQLAQLVFHFGEGEKI